MKPTVGFIGLGTIGLPMAERLLEQRFPLLVWNRTAAKASSLVEHGAVQAASPADLAARAEIVVTMVTDGPALEELAPGSGGMVAALAPGKVHCDMSTIDIQTSQRLALRHASHGVEFVHAPVLGNKRAAAGGALLIFAGGSPEGLAKCAPIVAALGRQVWRWDRPETATCVKLACNLLLGGIMELLAESLVLARQAGIEPEKMLDIFGSSALAAPMVQSKGEAIARRSFTPPSFHLRNMLKDLNLVLDAGKHLGIDLPGSRGVQGAFAAAAEHGLGDLDYSSVALWLEQEAASAAR